MYPTSPRVKPSTRSEASSRPRSDSAMRAELYTTPKATNPPSSAVISEKNRMVCSIISLNWLIEFSRTTVPATRGMRRSSR